MGLQRVRHNSATELSIQYCKAIILQLKINIFFKKNLNTAEKLQAWWKSKMETYEKVSNGRKLFNKIYHFWEKIKYWQNKCNNIEKETP